MKDVTCYGFNEGGLPNCPLSLLGSTPKNHYIFACTRTCALNIYILNFIGWLYTQLVVYLFSSWRKQFWRKGSTILTPKTKSIFLLISFHVPYFENEWAKSKWVNTRVVVSKVCYNRKKTWSKKKLQFGSKWISKLTTRIDLVVWPVFIITKFFGNASFF
jgi:hypothetical protein